MRNRKRSRNTKCVVLGIRLTELVEERERTCSIVLAVTLRGVVWNPDTDDKIIQGSSGGTRFRIYYQRTSSHNIILSQGVVQGKCRWGLRKHQTGVRPPPPLFWSGRACALSDQIEKDVAWRQSLILLACPGCLLSVNLEILKRRKWSGINVRQPKEEHGLTGYHTGSTEQKSSTT